MAEQHFPEFLRGLDPATALAIARLELPDLQNELAILRAARDEDEEETYDERVIREESELLQRAITALYAALPKSPCVACEDIIENPAMATVPCNHKFCRNCLQGLFQRSQIDESLFPPKCCLPILPAQVREFLTPELIAMHKEKKVEFETVDRTYCSNLQCHRFLRPEYITGDLGTCATCNQSTCTNCKTTAHGGDDCPRDEATEALLRYGTAQGWRRCFSCRRLVGITLHVIVVLLLRRPRRLNEAVAVAPQPPPVAVIRQAAAPLPVPEHVPLLPDAPPAQLIVANAIPPPAQAPLPPAVLVVAPQHAQARPQAVQPRLIAPQDDGVALVDFEPIVDAPRDVVPNVPQPPQPQAIPVILEIAQQPNIAPLRREREPCNHVGVEWAFAHGADCHAFDLPNMAPGLPHATTAGLDDETAVVIIKIQLQDVIQLLKSEWRKSAGRPSDFEQTLLLQKRELQTALTSINDRQMSRSMACAVLADSQAIEKFVAQERLAETDRAYACRLGGVAIPPPSNRPTPPQTPRNGPPTYPARPPATRPQARQSNFRPETIPPQTPRSPASYLGEQETPTPSVPRPAAPRANAGGPRPPLPQPSAHRTPSTNIQGQKACTPSNVGGAQPQISRPATDGLSLAQSSMRRLEENKPTTAPTLAKSFAPHPHLDAKIVSSSSASHDCKGLLKEVNSENGKPLEDVSPKPTAVLEDTAGHTNVSTPVQALTVLGKRAQEDTFDTSTAKRQCTGQAKSLNDYAGASIPIQPVTKVHATALNPVALQMTSFTKRPLEDSTEILPPIKRIDTGKTKDGVLGENDRMSNPTLPVSLNGVSKESTTQLKGSTSAKPSTMSFGQLSCVSCGGVFYAYNAARMSCQHVYCRDCVRTVVKTALIDEAMFPPRCCKQPFQINDMRRLLTPELNSQYGEKKIEFETSDRTYCSKPNCSTFLHPDNVAEKEKIGICPVCFIATCTICKGGEHIGDCPKDSDANAKQNGVTFAVGSGKLVCVHNGKKASFSLRRSKEQIGNKLGI
ncbi:hypothetical protein LOCC1_G000412 [Lachnellula occidentalis]|uniref:RING-type domain-containing protein n=1 Tax=Lachnellula occidentalis TaxID=215460 RepID=A0A8H8S9K6_9HELO|nr:hypothetical protein LOCC1_G000412 [Lachnellula occidentalis]